MTPPPSYNEGTSPAKLGRTLVDQPAMNGLALAS